MALDNPNKRVVIDKAVAANIAVLRTTFLARVIEYTISDTGVPLVDVQPIVKGRDNNGQVFDKAVLHGLPYYPLSAGAFIVYMPLSAGDIVECCAVERSTVEYVINGSTDYAADDPRKHSEADAFVRGKVRSRVDEMSTDVVNASNLVIGFADGTSRIAIKANGEITLHGAQVRLGTDTASEAVALNSQVLAQLQALATSVLALQTWYNTGVAAAVVAGIPIPAQFKPVDIPSTPVTPALVGATKVKAI